jgi:lipopolysaccharide/colanic/teichoic acid biosynthesis glycosyltransferase
MRRLFDLALAIPVTLLALPFVLLIGLAVFVVLGKPVLFAQARSGHRGRPFVLLKFRTMCPPVPGSDPLAEDHSRTPPFGRALRRTRLDELPQLCNILAGDMGFVGPRPLLPRTIAQLGARGAKRGAIRPGLAGWAQLHGGPQLNDNDKLTLDLWYLDNRSVMLDLNILVRTVGVVLFGDKVNSKAVEHAHAGRHRRGG